MFPCKCNSYTSDHVLLYFTDICSLHKTLSCLKRPTLKQTFKKSSEEIPRRREVIEAFAMKSRVVTKKIMTVCRQAKPPCTHADTQILSIPLLGIFPCIFFPVGVRRFQLLPAASINKFSVSREVLIALYCV
jgi:hypothetical protein